jgi:hypothetical protein
MENKINMESDDNSSSFYNYSMSSSPFVDYLLSDISSLNNKIDALRKENDILREKSIMLEFNLSKAKEKEIVGSNLSDNNFVVDKMKEKMKVLEDSNNFLRLANEEKERKLENDKCIIEKVNKEVEETRKIIEELNSLHLFFYYLFFSKGLYNL